MLTIESYEITVSKKRFKKNYCIIQIGFLKQYCQYYHARFKIVISITMIVSSNSTQASTYVYVFSHPSKMPFIYMPWMGADHADDLQYVFAKPLRNKRGIYKEEEVQMSKALMTYWTNFAWTGLVCLCCWLWTALMY